MHLRFDLNTFRLRLDFIERENPIAVVVAALALWVQAVFLVSCSGLPANERLVQLVPVVLDTGDPDRQQFGALTLMSAFELKSGDRRFGGISGVAIGPDDRLYAVSDRGHWLAARMVLGPNGALEDLVDWEIKPLLAPDNTAVKAPFGDAEALARGPEGSFIVGFEQRSRLWRYAPPPANFASPPVALPMPPELAGAPKNGGVEALTVLPDGRMLALTEEFENPDGTFKGWLIDAARFDALSYRPSDGFRVSDCAALANGDVLVLELRVDPEDVGKIIGKQGRTVRALRTVVDVAGRKFDRRFEVEVIEE